MDAQFRYAGTNRLDISEQTMLQPSDSRGDDAANRRIGKAVIERLHAVSSLS